MEQPVTTPLGAPNEFCWMDLKTRDIPGTAAYFSAVLGWQFAVDEHNRRRAVTITAHGQPIGTLSDLANPIYPPGTPPHIAYYLRVDDVDQRVEAATANGAQLVLAPFDAGDQGRVATLLDPVGAHFSLWQPYEFSGWDLAGPLAAGPLRMVLACDRLDEARSFYREQLGTALECAEFVTDRDPSAAPQWELAVGVDDLDDVAARARDHGGQPTWSKHAGRPAMRLSSPEGLPYQVRPL
jgi:predicted enzyme related to lactoylglutathione lyase